MGLGITPALRKAQMTSEEQASPSHPSESAVRVLEGLRDTRHCDVSGGQALCTVDHDSSWVHLRGAHPHTET